MWMKILSKKNNFELKVFWSRSESFFCTNFSPVFVHYKILVENTKHKIYLQTNKLHNELVYNKKHLLKR